MNCLFGLVGERFDLEDMLELFSTGPCQVVRYDSVTYLSLKVTDGLNDEQAIAVAEDRLSIMNGLGFLHDKSFRPVRIFGIGTRDPDTGKITVKAYMTGSSTIRVRARAKVRATERKADGTVVELEIQATEAYGESVLRAAAIAPDLQRALFLYGKLGHNWRELCLVLEAIEEGNGGERALRQKPWADRHLKHLKATANSFKALGHEARHGRTSIGIPSPSITLMEAREALKTTLNGWVAELLRTP